MSPKSPSARRQLLMVTHRVPHPPNRGDRIRTWNLLRALSPHFDIHLACVADEQVHYDSWLAMHEHAVKCAIEPMNRAQRLVRGGISLLRGRSVTEGAFLSPALKRQIDEWAGDIRFDAALGVCSSTASYLSDLPIARKIIDLVDVDSHKWLDYAEWASGPMAAIYRQEARCVENLEKAIAADFSAVSVVTHREGRLLKQIAPQARVIVAPNGVAIPPMHHETEPDSPTAVFVGSMDYMPNIQGVLWMAREIWPTIRGQFPSARLQIVGRRPVTAIRRLDRVDGIEVVGEVADVQSYLRQATVAVAPLWIARGVQNKVLEAMAVNRPVLVSPEVAGGIGAEEQQEMIVAGSVDQWVDGLTRLFTDRTLRQQLGWAGRKFVQTYHRWNVCTAPLTAALAGCSIEEIEGLQSRVLPVSHEATRQAA